MGRITDYVLSLPQGARQSARQRLLQPLLKRIDRTKPFDPLALKEAAREIAAALDAIDNQSGRQLAGGDVRNVASA
jgi:hypothetical protein